MTRLDLARRPKRGPICGACDRRYFHEGHADGCALATILTPAAHAEVERKRRALADVLTPAYLERLQELARPASLAMPGPRRGDGGQS